MPPTAIPRPPVLLHLHVPKCAGSSINNVLGPHFGRRRISISPGPQLSPRYASMTPEERDRSFDCGFGHLLFGEHRNFLRRCVYFSATRDPVARFCSHFNHMHTRPENREHQLIKDTLLDLNEIDARSVEGLKSMNVFTNTFCRFYAGAVPPADADEFVGVRRRVVFNVKAGNVLVAELAEVEEFLRAIGIAPLPRANVTDAAGFDDFAVASPAALTPAARTLIEAEFCQWDYRLLDIIAALPERPRGAEFAAVNGLGAYAELGASAHAK